MQMRLLSGLVGLGIWVLCAGMAAAQMTVGFGGVAFERGQPVEVTSDSLTIDQQTGEAVFTGNVLIVQGDLRMAAGRVRVVYAESGGRSEVSEVLASDGVLVTRGVEAAEGREARYSVDSAILTISGDVLVTQGPTAVAGDRLVVDMRSGSGQVEGRVRTVLDTGGSQ